MEIERKKESQEDTVETYEEAFARIREMTGEEDMDILVNHFIKVEDTNFALFNYVNEQNSEIEKLSEDISDVSSSFGCMSIYCNCWCACGLFVVMMLQVL